MLILYLSMISAISANFSFSAGGDEDEKGLCKIKVLPLTRA